MPRKRPVFLFAFANDAQNSLRLGEEQNACWNELASLDKSEVISCKLMGAITLEQLYKEFNRFHDQIFIFHYGGHSDSELIHLKKLPGKAINLGTKVGQQKNLKLVFLNGCKNKEQVKALFAQGVPAVIATSSHIKDNQAIELAQQFYQALAAGNTIEEAFAPEEIASTEINRPTNLVTQVSSVKEDILMQKRTGKTLTTNNEDRSKPLILIAEDNYDLRAFLTQSLGNRFRTLEAENGKEGYELAKKYTPDLIVSDIMMPIMDGLELCSRLKTNIQTSHIPIILLTAKAMVENWVDGLETGADDFESRLN